MTEDPQDNPTAVVDARGLQCPMPLGRASQAAKTLEPGQWVEVLATDRGSVPDFQAWIDGRAEYELLLQDEKTDDDGRTVYIHHVKRV